VTQQDAAEGCGKTRTYKTRCTGPKFFHRRATSSAARIGPCHCGDSAIRRAAKHASESYPKFPGPQLGTCSRWLPRDMNQSVHRAPGAPARWLAPTTQDAGALEGGLTSLAQRKGRAVGTTGSANTSGPPREFDGSPVTVDRSTSLCKERQFPGAGRFRGTGREAQTMRVFLPYSARCRLGRFFSLSDR